MKLEIFQTDTKHVEYIIVIDPYWEIILNLIILFSSNLAVLMSTVMIHKAWEPYIFKTNLCRECRSFALSASDFLAVAVNCCQQLRERERERERK